MQRHHYGLKDLAIDHETPDRRKSLEDEGIIRGLPEVYDFADGNFVLFNLHESPQTRLHYRYSDIILMDIAMLELALSSLPTLLSHHFVHFDRPVQQNVAVAIVMESTPTPEIARIEAGGEVHQDLNAGDGRKDGVIPQAVVDLLILPVSQFLLALEIEEGLNEGRQGVGEREDGGGHGHELRRGEVCIFYCEHTIRCNYS